MTSGRKIGVTGHQQRSGLDWAWTREQIAIVIRNEGPFEEALTSLAVGTDQLFAEEALDQNVALTAVIPFEGYERCFTGAGLSTYLKLLAASTRRQVLHGAADEQEAFLAAGLYVADQCDLLLAVWDGKPAQGLGGTADVVQHALHARRRILHLDPFTRSRRLLPAE